ncbi:CARDB domain-containing protein [Thioflavicoccus mobilis]|nr:CARDB domain-containing protein [Thioflavicoccus mobilis]
MLIFPSRPLSHAALVIAALILAPLGKAKADDIVSFQVLSDMQDKLVLEIRSYYGGSQGATAYLSVLPTVDGRVVSGIGYSSGSCQNNNSISTGMNSTCMTLSSVNPGYQIVTNGLEICMFGGASRNKFYCESFGYEKRWGGGVGLVPPHPGRRQSDLQVTNLSIHPDPVVQSQIKLHTYGFYRVHVSILNRGASAPAFTVRTECMRNDINYKPGETRVDSMQQGQTRDVGYDIFPSSAGAGSCMMRKTVDADRQVNESDESPLSISWGRAIKILR